MSAMNEEDMPALYSLQEVAAMFSMSHRTLRDWIRKGKLKAFKLNGNGPWRVPREEVIRIGNQEYGS